MGLEPTARRLALAALVIASSTARWLSLTVLQATMAFWTVETLELMNSFIYGGAHTARFPLEIYQRWLRRFFTFVVPLACTSYWPVVALLGRNDPLGVPPWGQWLAPLAALAFLAASLRAWRWGVRHHCSTGS